MNYPASQLAVRPGVIAAHGWKRSSRRLLILLALLFTATPIVHSDTIIFKNGRRLLVESVRKEGNKIIYEGQFGSVTIPSSRVERIEQGGAMPSRRRPARPSADASSGGKARLATPWILPTGNFAAVLLDGEVNDALLDTLVRSSHDGDIERQNALNAHLLASAYEVQAKRFSSASRYAEQAVRISPLDRNALMLAAQIDLALRQYNESYNHLLAAHGSDPGSPDVLKMLGYSAYYADGPEKAVWYWKQSVAIRPDPMLDRQIRQTEQEAQVESNLQQAESYNFVLSWEGSQAPAAFGREILETMERQFRELEISLHFTPREPVQVILYSSQQFADITRAPAWAGALNDGKIRVPVQGLTSMTPDLAQVLQHEMVHSFVYQFIQGRCPTWLNEGLAQMLSGKDSSRYGSMLVRVYSGTRVKMSGLEGSYTRFNGQQAGVAYAVSLAAAEMIRDQYGDYMFPSILEALRAGESLEQALWSVLRLKYEDFDEQVGRYVLSRYGD